MKTKNKLLTLLEIAIVLCSLFLVAISAIAAEQNQEIQKVSSTEVTTTSEDDYVLGVYGNANEDDTIDMRDLTYVKLIFFGKKPETELSDAKYDGKINPLDFIQIKLIIVGKEKELSFVCDPLRGKDATINKPVGRIVVLTRNSAEAIRILQAGNKVVGLGSDITNGYKIYFSDFISTVPCVGSWYNVDIEAILNVKPDIVLVWTGHPDPGVLEKKLQGTGVVVVRMDFCEPDEMMENEFKKLGYVLDKEEEAKEFIDFYKHYMDKITERTERLSEDDKPRVMVAFGDNLYTAESPYGGHKMCVAAGGTNIAAGLSETGYAKVDPEWIIQQNPDIIVQWPAKSAGYESDDTTDVEKQLEEIMNRPGWEGITAVKKDKVYLVAGPIWSSPACFIGIAYFAKWFHPDLFEDLDPQAVHQEYVTRFQRIDFNVYEHGIFVYPPLAS